MKYTLWFTGLSGSGKTTIGNKLIEHFRNKGETVVLLDGDILRDGLNKDLGFSLEDRHENIRRASEIAKLLNIDNIIVIATFITPTNEIRNLIKSIIPVVKFIYLDCDLRVCEERDVKGLYRKAREGKLKNFSGIDSPFEKINDAWMTLKTDEIGIDECIEQILKRIR
jgi:adenylyl-sulfate kinase